ncbi:GGDEF domain-containing protein [Novosphingobium sp. Leaf2]|uniref:GGDEF domain-containing protein n=1 Tax=Novosphingobium sp. Leaf2 TaxID=1735670 RepID=UPI0006F60B62|nr:sensor domain-containing diguanylate cyclase [Novosphingobium sp. Leaf2]KQM18988.1 diguanylate cyclase [Novosphingobium sp. Leaf2]
MNPSSNEALYELCGFARVACEADLVMALEVDEAGRASPVASSPPHAFSSFNLSRSGLFDSAWSAIPAAASGFRLPTAVIHALPEMPASLLFVPAPAEHAPKSGLLLLWAHAPSPAPLIEHVRLLASSVASTLAARREAVRQVAMRDQFNDLLESVPSGIVLFDGDGQSAMINERAAALLACRPGSHRASELAAPMRALRERCANHAELEAAYAARVGNVHFAAAHHWVLGDKTYEVDTHPVSGDGQHGRIWLFTDVTAELRIAATLRGLAQSDPLTGLPNRRHFEEQSAQILTAAATAERAVALLMVDIDHFKQINDTHGHPVGDAVLKAVAGRCNDVLREGDLFARFGGEEFIGLLTITTENEAAVIAERLRNAIASTPVLIGQIAITVSASVGGATTKTTDPAISGILESLIESADAALYRAKQAGRNRVIMA